MYRKDFKNMYVFVYDLVMWQVIAGITGPCSPPECCVNGSDTRWGYYGTFMHKAPCVLAVR